MTKQFCLLSLAICMSLSACSGGSAGPNSIPAPPLALNTSSPPPPSARPLISSVDFLAAPTTAEFATFTAGQPLRIRYDASLGRYEVMAPGKDWDALIDDPLSEPGLNLFASVPNLSSGYVSAQASYNNPAPDLRYTYSSLAFWALGSNGSPERRGGIVAFGEATPAAGVPLSGSASFGGIIRGSADVVADAGGYGKIDRAPLGGTVSFQFDFNRSSLTGQIRPVLSCDCTSISFPTLDFQAMISAGSPTFSGKFNTDVSGPNTFSGLFTGPHAEELMGSWTFPFLNDQIAHSATGVWIAKRGN